MRLAAEANGPESPRIVERVFRGGLTHQLRDGLRHIEGLTTTLITRRPTSPQARVTRSYPLVAVREALVNAVFHRGYDVDTPDPTKVCIHPDRMETTSYPGPVPGIEAARFQPGACGAVR